jgi:transposase
VVRLYKDLLDERGSWHQRIAATLFHQGVPAGPSTSTAGPRRRRRDGPVAGRAQAVEAGLRQIGRLTGELDPLRRQPDMISRRQPGCRALRTTQYGVGPVTAVAIWAELGDVRRFGNSDDVIRHTGLDVTAYSSDGKRSAD